MDKKTIAILGATGSVGRQAYEVALARGYKVDFLCAGSDVRTLLEMTRALSLAARRGVDVRLIVPAIPDKKIVYELTQSHFPELIENGVKVYKFTPGFVHSKVFLADDRVAVVGSINLDYRSLTLHFENACLFVDHPILPAVKADFEQTLPRCECLHTVRRRFNMLYEFYLGLLRLFAPLM